MYYFNQGKRTALLLFCSLLPLVCLAQQRSNAEAFSIAKDFCKSTLTSKIRLGAFVKSSSELSWSAKLSSTNEAYYIFNGLDKGFVIVSGDERMPAILAYSDNSIFECEELPPATRYWLDCFEETYLRLNGTESSFLPESSLSLTEENNVEPLLGKIKWGQEDPFNKFCPSYSSDKCLTGCVATAMAQVMRFHGYPERGKGQIDYYTSSNHLHVSRDLSNDFFDWESMLECYNNGNYQKSNADAVATLMVSCGTAVKMDYGTSNQGGSGAYQADLLSAFIDNFGYDTDAAILTRSYFTTREWHDFLIKELEEGRPVNYSGQSPRDGGHSFVIDGYHISTANVYPDYHINWGWNGDCDGYYQIADLLPKEDGQNVTIDGFNSSQQMTVGIRPNDGIDNNNFVLATEKLQVSTTETTPGSTIRVYTASMCNFSYQKFSGYFSVVLVGENGNEYLVELNDKAHTLSSLQVLNNVAFDLTLPSSMPKGVYSVSLKTRDDDHSGFAVFSSSYPQIKINSNEDSHEHSFPVFSALGCSDIEILNAKDNEYEILLNIYELQNLEENPFIGDIKMILADGYGKALCTFGDSIQIGELGMYEVQPDPFMLKGFLSEDWPDGIYRLYIGARHIDSTEYQYIKFYDIAHPWIDPQDLYYDLRIGNGVIIIEGHRYIQLPLDVTITMQDSKRTDSIVTINGFIQRNNCLLPGIVIVNGRKILNIK